MRIIRKTLFMALLATLTTAGIVSTAMAQYGANNSSTRDLVRRINTRTDTLRNTVQNVADRNYRLDDLDRLITDFSSAVDQLDRRLASRRTTTAATTADVRVVLDRATLIDSFLLNNRVGGGSQRDWRALRGDLDQLASVYNINWQWATNGGNGNDYNLSEVQLRQLVQRIDTRTTTFSRALRLDLNRNFTLGGYSRDQVRQQLSNFENAVVEARNRVNTRQFNRQEVRNLLQSAAVLNNFVSDRQLSYQSENSWNLLKPELDSLARGFNMAADWTTLPGGGPAAYAGLTGTYRIDNSQGDNARNAVDAATRNLSLAERQRVYDSLLRRLDPPQMLALDRRGNAVTIASTRAPQINFVADGREQVETTRNGRTVRVRASLSGEALTIVRTGDRANDFSVTFDPNDAGRRLLVTRTLYSDRLSQPVSVRNYYDRVSDVAQLNIYDTNREEVNNGETAGNFVVPNGTALVATLDTNLSTQNVSDGQRFTMTVRSPRQYEGAVIEGYVSSVNRSGRVTGRSEMTLDFDTIRMRDGRSYRFAGILDTVRTPSGDVVRVDNEGAIRDSNQTDTTVTRTAIGSAVGAIIGAIAGGGKGAAIGAAIGAGAGAGSVYIQGRNDLELNTGTEITVRATGPSNARN